MAKKNLDEPCIFCGGTPCECEGTAPKKNKKPSPSPRQFKTGQRSSPKPGTSTPETESPSTDTSVSVEQHSDLDGVFDSVLTDTPQLKSRFKQKQNDGSPRERDLSLESALFAIREIVCGVDRRKIDRELADIQVRSRPRELDKQVAAWRKRNGST